MRYLIGRMHVISIILVACLILAGCASTRAALPTSTPAQPASATEATAIVTPEMPAPATEAATTSTPQPTSASAQPAQTESPMQENTPVPTATNFPVPAVPLSATGPWLLFMGTHSIPDEIYGRYLWAMNQDGTGLTRLTNEEIETFAVRPTSSIATSLTIAYTTLSGTRDNPDSTVKLLSWPSGDIKTIVYHNATSMVGTYDLSEAYDEGGLVWSPTGDKLAFVGAMADATVNVFVYDINTEQITRISANNDSHDYKLVWSPDEQYVIHQGFVWWGMEGAVSLAIWSARVEGGGINLLTDRYAYGDTYHPMWDAEYLGWLSSREFIYLIPQVEVRIANVETGNYTTVTKEPFLDVAFSHEHNLFLMTKDVSPSPNRLLIFYQNGERREIAGYTIKYVEWLSAYDVFLGQTPDGRAYLISPDGTVTEIPTPQWSTYDPQTVNSHFVFVSPDHQWWAWHHSRRIGSGEVTGSELWVGSAQAQPLVTLSTNLSTRPTDDIVYSSNVIWSPDSQHLLWFSHDGDLWVASPPNFEAVLAMTLPTGYSATFSDAVWVK